MHRLSTDFEQFFLVKNYEKETLFWPGRNAQNGLILHTFWVFGCADSNSTGFEAVHPDVSVLWTICMHYLGDCSS